MPARSTSASARGSSRISVLVANDQPILRDGLRAILDAQRDIRVVASVRDGSEAVREIERQGPQVALLGIAMAGLNGIEATRIIAGRSPAVGVLILSVHSTPAMVQRALDAGALGYLSRECSGDELVKGVRAVAAGSRYLSQGLAEKFLDHHRGVHRGEHAVESLTATERQIVKLVAEGESNPAVAKILGLSPRTVETYRLRLMRKLSIDNLASLVRYAIRNGITPLD
ncbi:MAG TPA: response regulator transcription factor [Burkholderiales bacterium]|nr:response regulator transcription factor [Burkholderiales bacterium]